MKNEKPQRGSGFTLIEVIVIVALLSAALVFVSTNLFSPSQEAKLDATTTDITSLIKEAQNKAMNTDSQGDPTSDEFGIHFESQSVTLFKGSTYDSADPANFKIDIPNTISASADLPCPSPPGDCNNIVFQRISGEVVSFSGSKKSICITESTAGKNTLLSVNFVGVVNTQDGC